VKTSFGPWHRQRKWAQEKCAGRERSCAQLRGWNGVRPGKGSFQSIYEKPKVFKTSQTMAVQRRCSYHGHLPPPLHRQSGWSGLRNSPTNPPETTLRWCESVAGSSETHLKGQRSPEWVCPIGQISCAPSAHHLCPLSPIDSETIWNRNMQIPLRSHWVKQLASRWSIHSKCVHYTKLTRFMRSIRPLVMEHVLWNVCRRTLQRIKLIDVVRELTLF